MTTNRRAPGASVSETEVRSPSHRNGRCAAGLAQPRSGGIATLKPISADHHAKLVRLIEIGRMIRRPDGYGSDRETMMSFTEAEVLKARRLAVGGFDHEIVATERGKALVQQQGGAHGAN